MKHTKLINGIQQVGIGVKDITGAWDWYREHFGTDICVFEDKTVAELMLPYTGNKPRQRHAALAFNLQGGGGFEIWQYTEREPVAPNFEISCGDYGIFICKIKSRNVHKTYEHLSNKNSNLLSGITNDPAGKPHFYVKDPFNNIFEIVEGKEWFKDENKTNGGVSGVVIGVSDIDKSLKVYSSILNYSEIVYDKEGEFEDLKHLPGGEGRFRRVLLCSNHNSGGFSPLLGSTSIELIQALDREPKKIFSGRYWGDQGFIHICMDVINMDALKKECEKNGFPFTVDSSVKHNTENSFDMGEAAGHFSYIEDPDGTLIEFVETHKVPIIKSIGWYLNVRGKNPEKPISKWIIRALKFNKRKQLA